eukprot:8786977-Pyramimonas_sp.AAC.1
MLHFLLRRLFHLSNVIVHPTYFTHHALQPRRGLAAGFLPCTPALILTPRRDAGREAITTGASRCWGRPAGRRRRPPRRAGRLR